MEELLSYLRIIRKWWWVIVLVFLSVVGTILIISLRQETQYQASVTLQVSAPPPQEVPLYSQFGRQALRDEIDQTRISLSEYMLEGDAPHRALERLPDIPMKGGELRDRTTTEVPEDSQLVRVQVRSADAETAALLANTLVEAGLESYGELQARSTASTRQFIQDELENVRKELRAAEAELAQFQIVNRVINLEKAIDAQYDYIKSLRMTGDLARAEGNIEKAQAIEETIIRREIDLQNLIGMMSEYNTLVEHLSQVRASHDFLLASEEEAQIKESQILALGYIQIITPALPPRRPIPVIQPNLFVLGGIASIAVGVVLVLFLEYVRISGAFQGFRRQLERSEIQTLPDEAN